MIYLLSSIGLPGSGKSTFLKRFAHEQRFFYWQNDEARRQIFAQPQHTPDEHKILGSASHYVFDQLLQLGQSCIYDVNLNQRRHRRRYTQLAHSRGAQFVLLWFQVPVEVAQERAKRRAEQATGELKAYLEGFDPDVVNRMALRLEKPEAGEKVVIVDGTLPFSEQSKKVLAVLSKQL